MTEDFKRKLEKIKLEKADKIKQSEESERKRAEQRELFVKEFGEILTASVKPKMEAMLEAIDGDISSSINITELGAHFQVGGWTLEITAYPFDNFVFSRQYKTRPHTLANRDDDSTRLTLAELSSNGADHVLVKFAKLFL